MADVPRASKIAWRPWLRAFHRDTGYVAVGLTLVYALSGLAVNHIQDWDPNFRNYETVKEIGPVAGPGGAVLGDDAAADLVRTKLGIGEPPREVYRNGESDLDLLYERRTIHVNVVTGHVVDEGQKPRFFLRAANWLHLNRGKKAWKWVADGYAAALLFLAISGLFMVPGRKGVFGRGALYVAVGVAIPVVYVVLAPS
ncbi:MAG: PepSY-associated TM helix domain-containing protein [Polyangiaceae bacterium]